jgi:1,4-dihydroxy-2-naphthoyl-CoA hydrolase
MTESPHLDPADLVALMPFAEHLGMRPGPVDADRGEATLAWAPHLCTGGGILHGGVLMAVADSLGAAVTFVGLPAGARTATITSTTQMFRPVAGGDVRAVAETLHRGRTVVTVRTTLYDEQDRMVSQTTQVQAVLA